MAAGAPSGLRWRGTSVEARRLGQSRRPLAGACPPGFPAIRPEALK